VVPAAVGQPGNGVFAAVCLMLLIAGLVSLLMLNTAMAEGSFTLGGLQKTSGELADTQNALTQAVDAQRSPANLAARASKLGMVPAESAAFLRLSDGKVLGVASQAKANPGFTVVTAPQTSAQAPGKPAPTSQAPKATVTTKGDVTTTTVVVGKPDGSVVTTVTSVNAKTKATTSTTTTTTRTVTAKATPAAKPSATPANPAGTPAH
jgi:hypothetical protein